MNTALKLTPPAVGEVWTGQGGIYAGIVPARNGAEAYHLVIGEELGRFEWGPYEVEAPATSLTDGLANTLALLESGDEYPAAQAAAARQADGHNDFYLPAAAELYEAWLNLGYKDWGWVWSSSQRSANDAFNMLFGGGTQDGSDVKSWRAPCPARPQIAHSVIHSFDERSSSRFLAGDSGTQDELGQKHPGQAPGACIPSPSIRPHRQVPGWLFTPSLVPGARHLINAVANHTGARHGRTSRSTMAVRQRRA